MLSSVINDAGHSMSKHDNLLCLADETMTPEQRFALGALPLVNLFAVVSWGCAATSWLARALNSHPDIYCEHAANVAWNRFAQAQVPDGIGYLRVIAAQASAYKAAGDVHGISRNDIPRLRSLLGDAFEAAVLVRDPLLRLQSQAALFKRWNYRMWGDLAYVDAVMMHNGIDPATLSIEQRHFVHGVLCLNAITDEQTVGRVFRSEELTTDPEALADFVALLTRKCVVPSVDWAKRAIAVGPVNTHRTGISAFGQWEKDVIRRCVTREAWTAYEMLGYAIPDFLGR